MGAKLAARLGIDTFEQHLAGDTLVQDATGVRRLPGNLLDAPPVSSRRAEAHARAIARARFPERWRRRPGHGSVNQVHVFLWDP